MASGETFVTFKDIKYYPYRCVQQLEDYEIYDGTTWDDNDDQKREKLASIIRIREKNLEETMEDEEDYISRNFDLMCQRESDTLYARELFHQNVHGYHKMRVDKENRLLYIAAERVVCNLTQLIQLPKDADYPVKHEGELVRYTGTDGTHFDISKKELMRQISTGVAHFHGLGRVHRNLTPDNIFIAVDKSSNRAIAKISAFFLSKQTRTGDSTASFSGTRTRGWSPREMLVDGTQRVGKEVDIFSLGCLFYYILTGGGHPFNFKDRNIKSEKFSPGSLAPSNEGVLIARMISHDPKSRPHIEEVKRNPALRDEPYYLLYCHDNGQTKPGLCAIFNQQNFIKKKLDVSGFKYDEAKLQETFKQFGFDVEVFRNKTAEKICEQVENLSAREKYQSIVLCFMSHGTETGILGSDCVLVPHRQLRNYFASSPKLLQAAGDPRNCTRDLNAFHQKPKIFLYLACRGDKTQYELIRANPKTVQGDEHAWADQGLTHATSPTGDALKAAALSDYLEVYATIDQYKAFTTSQGSPFIQTLCDELAKEAAKKDFRTVAESLNFALQQKARSVNMPVVQVISVEGPMEQRLQLEKQ